MNKTTVSLLLAAALAAPTAAGCKSEPPRYPSPTTTKPEKKGAATQGATQAGTSGEASGAQESAEVAEPAAGAVICPGGTVLMGAMPPNGQEQWCAQEPGHPGSPKHGPIVHWWDDGAKQFEGQYANGQMDGTWSWYGRNGQKTKEGQFIGGRKHGKWTFWDATGMKVGAASFLNGKMTEQWVWQKDKNGKIKETHTDMKGFSSRMGGHESPPVGAEGSTGGAGEGTPAAPPVDETPVK